MAESVGCYGENVSDPAEVGPALQRALKVVRDGTPCEIAVDAVVSDDLLMMRAGDQVVVHGRPSFAVQTALLAEHRPDPLLGAQPRHAVLPGGDAAGGQLMLEGEPVPVHGLIHLPDTPGFGYRLNEDLLASGVGPVPIW